MATIWHIHVLLVIHNRRRKVVRIPSRGERRICLHAFVSLSQSFWYVLMKMRPNVVNLSEVSLEAICSDIRESHVMARDGITKWCFFLAMEEKKKTRTIGPLQDSVTWHGINYAGTQVTQWDFQNKGTLTSPARLSFVLKVPLCNLRPSVIGHFRITFSLFLKASLGAHPFIWKWV